MRRNRRRKSDPPGRAAAAQDIRMALDAQVRAATGKVPPEVMAKVLRIRESIQDLLPSLDHLLPGSPELFLIERTATNYLPIALENYLSLPPVYATTEKVQGGKTPKQLLLDQLGLIEEKMNELKTEIRRHDANRLLAHGRFLEERFGRSRESLRPPDDDASSE